MKVAMDVQVSTYCQALTQTIEQHIRLLSEHCQTHGWPWCEEHLFRDDGYSGASLRLYWLLGTSVRENRC